jgi:hypothetical protein
MPHHRDRLTPAIEQQITHFIRAGAYDWVAAEAAGIPRTTFRQWMEQGAAHARQPYRRFQEQVQQAKAQARIKAEVEVFRKVPALWLRHGPGRETLEALGWSAPAKPVGLTGDSVRAPTLAEMAPVLAFIESVLAPFPEAMNAVFGAIDQLPT